MELNADFTKRAVIRPGDTDWVPSPMAGVERYMLDRIGNEVARATSIVRYAPDSYFSEHTHGGGEEFLVLDGVFSDEHADYPAGSYVRNPIGTSHSPHSKDGCTIFVKLHQFDPADTEQKVIDTQTVEFSPSGQDGVTFSILHRYSKETVKLVRWESGSSFPLHAHHGGSETLVLAGSYKDEYGDYPEGSWIRSPHGSQHTPSSEGGCLMYVKTGHLFPA